MPKKALGTEKCQGQCLGEKTDAQGRLDNAEQRHENLTWELQTPI